MASEDLEKKVIRQIEYYFGDVNLPRDRFLKEEVKKDEGWIPLETMLNFNRLKQLSDDINVIAECLGKSTSGLIEVSEDGTKIRRNPEMAIPEHNEERKLELAAKSIYAKAFPLDSSLDDLQEFFEGFGEIDSISMRKDIKKKFKGSVFVTFRSEESMKKFLEAESVKYKDTELERRVTKNAYYEQKNEGKKKLQQEKQDKKDKATIRLREDEEEKIVNEMTHGALLMLKGIKSEETRREDIRNLFADYGPIAWIDFNRGDPECVLRYDTENKAKEVLERALKDMDNEIVLNEEKLETSILEGDEEVARWKKMHIDAISRKQQHQNKNSKNRQKGRWGKRPSKSVRDALKKFQAREEADKAAGKPDKEVKAGEEAVAVTVAVEEDEPPTKKMKVEETSGD